MCGKKRAVVPASTPGEAYEGQTQRLHAEGAPYTKQRCSHHGFPWWTLWLIWPLIALVKHAGAAMFGGWALLGSVLIPANVLLAVVLIVAGAALLLRNRAQKGE